MRAIIKTFVLGTALISSSISLFAEGTKCRNGLTWVISHSPSWGMGKPVVTRVQPYSSAEEAGIKVGDIIEVIDGYATKGLSPNQVEALLHSTDRLHTLQTSNLNALHRKHILGNECKPSETLTERELAELFSLYSVEDANLQQISYPYHYSQSTTYPLLQANSISLAPEDSKTSDTDRQISAELSKLFAQKGLALSPTSDLVLSYYYSLSPLPEDKNEGADDVEGFGWRYDSKSRELKPMPVYEPERANAINAAYSLIFGIQIQSRKTKEIVWHCEAKELLSEGISIADYAAHSMGAMLTGFPFTSQSHNPRLRVHTLRYNYTGLSYSSKQLNYIRDVETASPAMKAGLRPGDIVVSINGKKLNSGKSLDLLDSYFSIAERLDRYRDKNLPTLTSLIGNISISYWRVDSYPHIFNLLSKDNNTAFTYLFAFRPYILGGKESKTIIYEIMRDGETYYVPITPEYRDESTISIQ